MTITLTPEQEKLVEERVKSGRYLSPEHLTAEAFRLLASREDHERELAQLRGDIEAGWDEAASAKVLDGPKVMAAMLDRAQRRADAPQ
ncbi:MAG: type II toxin-antitoxin system ParD family antitoxin [Chthoniobacteraceae bacterium]